MKKNRRNYREERIFQKQTEIFKDLKFTLWECQFQKKKKMQD